MSVQCPQPFCDVRLAESQSTKFGAEQVLVRPPGPTTSHRPEPTCRPPDFFLPRLPCYSQSSPRPRVRPSKIAPRCFPIASQSRIYGISNISKKYKYTIFQLVNWCRCADSNRGPTDYEVEQSRPCRHTYPTALESTHSTFIDPYRTSSAATLRDARAPPPAHWVSRASRAAGRRARRTCAAHAIRRLGDLRRMDPVHMPDQRQAGRAPVPVSVPPGRADPNERRWSLAQ